jgi:hypothetical protein
MHQVIANSHLVAAQHAWALHSAVLDHETSHLVAAQAFI